MFSVSKSDEEFEENHKKYRQKVLMKMKKPLNGRPNINRTENYLNNWYGYVQHKRELINKVKRKSQTRKCTLLEMEINNEENIRRANLLFIARNKKCVQEEYGYQGIPKYIKEKELFYRKCHKNVHEECKERYFKEQLKINNAIELHHNNKNPHFDDLIVIGTKIEPTNCISPNVNERIEEKSLEHIVPEPRSPSFPDYASSLPFMSCGESDTLFMEHRKSIPEECSIHEIQIFLNKTIARKVSIEIFDSIVDDIFKENTFYLKMKYSSQNKDISSEVFENMEQVSMVSSLPNMILSSEKMDKPNCLFTRSPDYMLTYIKEKMKLKNAGTDNEKEKILETQISFKKLQKQSRIKAYWLNMLLSMDNRVAQVESSIGILNGYTILGELNVNSSNLMKDRSFVSSKSKMNASRSRSQAPNRSNRQLKESISMLPREIAKEKQLQNQIRKSQLFQTVIFLQFRYQILDAIDFVYEVLSTT